MLSNEDKVLLNEIVQHVASGNERFFISNQIDFGDKGEHWILNYRQDAIRNSYNRLCRGLVVHKSGKIHSFPFTRFFNYGEKDAVPVNLANCELLEKMDGTFVGVSFPEDTPIWHTRKMLSTHDNNVELKSFYGENFKLIKLIGSFVNKLNFADKNCTWMFEFVHKLTKVITEYSPDQFGLYLIGCRDLNTFEEKSEEELDHLALKIGAFRGRRWNALNSKEEIVKMFEQFPKDFEGVVAREKGTANRNKVKSDDYQILHHMLGETTYKRLLPRWALGEQHEIVAQFPHTKDKIDKIEIGFKNFYDLAMNRIDFWLDKGLSRKELAFQMMNKKNGEEDAAIRCLVFRSFENREDIPGLVTSNIKKMSTQKMKEVFKLDQDAEEQL